jgi:DnaJ family protein A protein 5
MDSEEEPDGQAREADNQKRASEVSTKQARGDASNSDSVPVSSINGRVFEVFARDVDTDVDEDEDQSARKAQRVDSETESDKSGQLSKDPTLEQLLAELEGTRVSSASPEPSKKQTSGKAKQRRQKKKEVENEFANKCSVCQTSFSSRNKLFDHIKASGHALAPRKGGR